MDIQDKTRKKQKMENVWQRRLENGETQGMVLLVLDASVVIKWFKDEEHKEQTLKIREDFYHDTHEIVIPDLMLYQKIKELKSVKFITEFK